MKLKNIITTLLAAVAFATGCQESLERHLDEVQVSSSYVAIPAGGGSKTITVTATAKWTISNIPEWLAIAPETGEAGETKVKFTAEAATSTNEATVNLVCNEKTQQINVIQQTEKQELPISTCDEVNKGEDGVSYRIKGTVTKITSTTYGNMYINDGTGEVYVYGTLDASGAEKNFGSLGIEAGDIVTVEGPRVTYSGTIELKNVTVIAIEKSLIKVDSLSVKTALPLEGGEFKAYLTCKGEGVSTVIPEDAKSWISVTGIEQEENKVTVIFNAAANAGGDRSTELSFTTKASGKTYSAVTTLEQKGAIIEATVAEFLAAEEGDTQYRLTGKIESIANEKYGNLYLQDATGRVYIYGIDGWSDLGLRQGDIITIVGKRASYANAKVEDQKEEMKEAVLEKSIKPTDVTVTEFLDKEVAGTYLTSPYYRLTGVVKKVVNDTYGNFYLKEENSDVYVYVYGLTAAPVAKNDKSFGGLNIAVGDNVTIVGQRGQYSSSKVEDQKEQVVNAYFISVVKGSTETIYTSLSEVNEAIIAAGTTGTDFKVNLTGAEVTKVCADGKTIYVQDATGAVMIYYSNGLPQDLKSVTEKTTLAGEITGKGVVYNGLPEVTSLDVTAATIAQDGKGICMEATIAEVLADINKYLNCKVKLAGVTVKTEFSNNARNGALSQGDSEIAVYVKNTAEEFSFYAGTEGDVYVYPGLYNTTKQVYFWDKGDFAVKTAGSKISLESSYTVNAGATVELGATCNSTATLKYSSADETIATVSEDGVVTGVKEGEVEITVSAEAVEGYTAASATTTVTVVPSGQAISKVLIIDGSQLTSAATKKDSTVTYSGTDIVFSSGAKSYSASGDNKFSNEAIFIGKSDTYIYNKTAIPGKITKFEIYANKTASAKVTVGVNFSAEPIKAYSDKAANTYTAQLSTLDNVYDCSGKLPEDAKYFWYQVTNSNNSQVQFRITYVEE